VIAAGVTNQVVALILENANARKAIAYSGSAFIRAVEAKVHGSSEIFAGIRAIELADTQRS
jgi:hypothetical protein